MQALCHLVLIWMTVAVMARPKFDYYGTGVIPTETIVDLHNGFKHYSNYHYSVDDDGHEHLLDYSVIHNQTIFDPISYQFIDSIDCSKANITVMRILNATSQDILNLKRNVLIPNVTINFHEAWNCTPPLQKLLKVVRVSVNANGQGIISLSTMKLHVQSVFQDANITFYMPVNTANQPSSRRSADEKRNKHENHKNKDDRRRDFIYANIGNPSYWPFHGSGVNLDAGLKFNKTLLSYDKSLTSSSMGITAKAQAGLYLVFVLIIKDTNLREFKIAVQGSALAQATMNFAQSTGYYDSPTVDFGSISIPVFPLNIAIVDFSIRIGIGADLTASASIISSATLKFNYGISGYFECGIKYNIGTNYQITPYKKVLGQKLLIRCCFQSKIRVHLILLCDLEYFYH